MCMCVYACMEIFLFPNVNVNASSCPCMPCCLSVYMKMSLTLLSDPSQKILRAVT